MTRRLFVVGCAQSPDTFGSIDVHVMPSRQLRAAIKCGALIAAANWQVTLIQAFADALFKLLLAAPVVGAVLLLALGRRRLPVRIPRQGGCGGDDRAQ